MIRHTSTATSANPPPARAAYQVGVLSAIRKIHNRPENPFAILTGTSAGGINAVALAVFADNFSVMAPCANWHRSARRSISELNASSSSAQDSPWMNSATKAISLPRPHKLPVMLYRAFFSMDSRWTWNACSGLIALSMRSALNNCRPLSQRITYRVTHGHAGAG